MKKAMKLFIFEMVTKWQRVVNLLHASTTTKNMDITWCSESFIFKVEKMVKEGNSFERKPGLGGHNKKDIGASVAAAIEADPTTSMRMMARDLKVTDSTVRVKVREMGLKSYVKRHCQLLSNVVQKGQGGQGARRISWFKHHRLTLWIFSDKKMWTVDQAGMTGTWPLAPLMSPPINRTKHPAGAMMLGVIISGGKAMPPYGFPQAFKMGQKEYLEVLGRVVKHWVDANYPKGGYVWQQDCPRPQSQVHTSFIPPPPRRPW